jgi:ribosomal protein S27AE
VKLLNLPIKRFQCGNCGQIIEVPQGIPKPLNCPRCGAPAMMIHRLNKGPPGGRRGRGRGPSWQGSQP